jgi:LuxR family maltose regulon positive regulatory protein
MNLDSEPSSVAPVTFPLLHTKQRPPQTHGDWVARPRLLQLLNTGLTHPVMVVSAPAGFGKTTLLAQWSSETALPLVWMSLDAHDNEMTRFLAYLVAAIQGLFPHTCAETAHFLSGLRPTPRDLLFTTFINELDEIQDPYILVLDDYHFVTEESINDLLAELALRAPGGLHLVVATRADPPLPLATLRARGDLTEVRASELCFSENETRSFLAPVLGSDVGADVYEIVGARIEGWIAGLRLAALSLQSGQTLEEFLTTLRQGGSRYVMAYLLSEVLMGQSRATQDFLLRTSILDQFSVGLCEALLDEMEPPAVDQLVVDSFDRLNLFLVRLDEGEGWYRYHHLFRELLQHELRAHASHEEVAALHRKASAWFADHDFMDEAIRHALAGEDFIGAVILVEAQVHPLMNQEQWRVLDQHIGMLPEHLVRQRPALLLARAIILTMQHRLDKIPPLLAEAEVALMRADLDMDPRDVRVARGMIDLLCAQDLYFKCAVSEGLAAAERAAQALPPSASWARGGALLFLGLFKQLTGQGDAGASLLQRAVDGEVAPTALSVRALLGLCDIYRQRGQLDRVLASAQRMLSISEMNHFTLDISWAHYFLGCVAYERNELDTASEHFLAVSEQRYHSDLACVYDSLAGLALTYQAQEKLVEAQEALRDMTEYALETNHPDVFRAVSGLRARLALANGEADMALSLFHSLDDPGSPLFFLHSPPVTQARILVARENASDLPRAVEYLKKLRQFAMTTHSAWQLHAITALQAVVEARLGNHAGALSLLRQTILDAQPHRFIRTFVDIGAPLDELLRDLQAEGVAPSYIDRLLAAFPSPPPRVGLSSQRGVTPNALPWQSETLLTEREIETLRLLAQRYSNHEIAQQLGISSFTVRSHARNIYRKLDVNNRRSAVAKANALGILGIPPGQ